MMSTKTNKKSRANRYRDHKKKKKTQTNIRVKNDSDRKTIGQTVRQGIQMDKERQSEKDK